MGHDFIKRFEASTAWKTALVLVCMSPFLCSVYASSFPAKQREIVNRSQLKSLAFDQYLVDRRHARLSKNAIFVRFGFINKSDQPVHINAIRPSCGCVKTRIEKQSFAAGERGEFILQIDTANETPGDKEYTAEVAYARHGKEEEKSEVTFRAVIPEKKLTVMPRALIFYHFDDQVTTQKLKLVDYRNKNVKVTKVESKIDFVRPILGVTKENEEGFPSTTVHVTVTDKVPLGRHQASVVIYTTDPDFPKVEVPLLIQRTSKSASRNSDNGKKKTTTVK